MDEEACAIVIGARLLGYTRGQMPHRAPNAAGCSLVWRADVELRPWEARFEIAGRGVAGPVAVTLSHGSHPFAVIIRRELAEAALTM